METIEEYLSRTERASEKLFEGNNSYWELLESPERPVFSCWGDMNSEENKSAYLKWKEENKEVLELRIKRDNEFAYEHFSRATLYGAILQFAFWGIEKFSHNEKITVGFEDIIKRGNKSQKFCIGRICEDIPIGLIVYAGRNQSVHFSEDKLQPVSKRVFDRLANWYSPRYEKWYKRDQFDLDNLRVTNCAESISYLLEWRDYQSYEKDILNMINAI